MTDQLHEAVTHQVNTPVPDDNTVADVIGRVRFEEIRLADYRRSLMLETEGTVEGDHYRIVEGRKAQRSYNTHGILSDVMKFSGDDLAGALMLLVASGVVELKWSWTKLGRWFAARGLTLKVANREVEDGGECHVGQVWSTTRTIEGKQA